MRKLCSLLLFIFFLSIQSFSQKIPGEPSANASNIFLEIAGNAGVFSLNYDTRLSKKNNGLGIRAGLGFGANPGHLFPEPIFTIPLAINYLIGPGPDYLEAGAGVTIGESNFNGRYHNQGSSTYFVPSVGYRRQPPGKGFTFRVFVSPFIATEMRFSAGASFGLRF
jgi:hypothetical protein